MDLIANLGLDPQLGERGSFKGYVTDSMWSISWVFDFYSRTCANEFLIDGERCVRFWGMGEFIEAGEGRN
jgi:hypothetical protein